MITLNGSIGQYCELQQYVGIRYIGGILKHLVEGDA